MRRLLLLLIICTALFAPSGTRALTGGGHSLSPEPDTEELAPATHGVTREGFAAGAMKVRHSDRRIGAPSGEVGIASTSTASGGPVAWVLILSSPVILYAITRPRKTRAPPYLQTA